MLNNGDIALARVPGSHRNRCVVRVIETYGRVTRVRVAGGKVEFLTNTDTLQPICEAEIDGKMFRKPRSKS